MEGCFMFQWGVCFSFLSGGGHWFWWGGFSKKIVRWGAAPHAPPLWETLIKMRSIAKIFFSDPYVHFSIESPLSLHYKTLLFVDNF